MPQRGLKTRNRHIFTTFESTSDKGVHSMDTPPIMAGFISNVTRSFVSEFEAGIPPKLAALKGQI